MNKPFMGFIEDWRIVKILGSEKVVIKDQFHLGYYIRGKCVGHPLFHNSNTFYTSMIVRHDANIVETLNSVYILIGPTAMEHNVCMG